MQKNVTALILILLGVIVLAFPLLGVIPLSLISGFIFLLLGIGFLVGGTVEMGESVALGILELILGIIALILGIGFIFNPGLLSWLVGFIVWITGLFLILAGIGALFTKTGGGRWNGIISMIIGLIYIIAGTYIANPMVLGTLIGLWLIIVGLMTFMVKE